MKDYRLEMFNKAAEATKYLVFLDSVSDGNFIAGFASEEAAYEYVDYLSTVSDDNYIVSF